MDASKVIDSLNKLRAEWMSKRGDQFFEGRGEWLMGVVKGIDLSIWTVRMLADRPGQSWP